jgi:hypothetical protein
VNKINAVEFFSWSDLLDYMVNRELSHIRGNWEMTWDHGESQYEPEEDSYAAALNSLFKKMSELDPPPKYHDNEDRLAEYLQQKTSWNIQKVNGRWIGAPYERILEQGGFGDVDQMQLMLAATGRVQAAIDRGQLHFDDMEESHRYMLAIVIIILYHKPNA